jgi:hypothetical protein
MARHEGLPYRTEQKSPKTKTTLNFWWEACNVVWYLHNKILILTLGLKMLPVQVVEIYTPSKHVIVEGTVLIIYPFFLSFFWRATVFLAIPLLMSPVYDFWGMSEFEHGLLPPSKLVHDNLATHPSIMYLHSSSDVSVKKCLRRDSVDPGSGLDSDSIGIILGFGYGFRILT